MLTITFSVFGANMAQLQSRATLVANAFFGTTPYTLTLSDAKLIGDHATVPLSFSVTAVATQTA